MSNSFFDNVPLISYKSNTIRDISRRAIVNSTLFNNPFLFLPYTINDDSRPEDVAFYYYEDSELVWLIYYANNIIDPYNQWPLPNEVWDKMMMKKYEAQSGETGYDILVWTQNTLNPDNILFYKDIQDSNITINSETYGFLSTLEKADYTPVRIYDYEMTLNDEKRTIQLIDKRYANQIVTELRKAVNV